MKKKRAEEPDEQSGEEEKEERCPPLEETMAASWIAQIGEEGSQRDRGGRLLALV